MKKRSSVLLGLALSLSLALTGCGGGQDANTSGEQKPGAEQTKGELKVLRVNNQSEPGSLHPGKAQGTHDSWVLEHMMEGLYKKTPNGIELGMAASEPEMSADGLNLKFKIRDNAVWSNGDPVTAKDFEVAWKYALNPATASEYAYQLYYLKGGEAYNTTTEKDAAKLKALEDAVGVKALDEKTLEVQLEQPTPYFKDLTTHYTLYPVNHKLQESNPNWANDASTYVSNGAFKITEWKHKESIKQVKNDQYYDQDKVKIDEIQWAMIEDENTTFQMYRSGELDYSYPLPQDVLGQLKSANDPELTIAPELATYYYRFNTTMKPFNNVKVRHALSMAIERQMITENVAQGGQKPAFGIVPPGIPDVTGDYQENTGDLFKEDVAEAKKLLAEGLKEEGMDKLPPFAILYNTNDGHKKIAEAVQEMWRKNLGLEVTLENVEFQVKIDREDKLEYAVSRAGWIGDYVDPMTFIDMFDSKSQQNDTGWKNAEYDKLVKTAKTTNDTATRMKAMHDAEKILMEDMPIMPIYYYTKPYAAKPHLKDIFTPANRYTQFMYADIQE